jgi:hypothetical protein
MPDDRPDRPEPPQPPPEPFRKEYPPGRSFPEPPSSPAIEPPEPWPSPETPEEHR